MVTDLWQESAKLTYLSSLCALALHYGWEDRETDKTLSPLMNSRRSAKAS